MKRDASDPAVVVVQAATAELHPLFDARAIAKALEDDPQSARAEHLAQFRSHVESFVQRKAVDAVVISHRYELPRRTGVDYRAFLDFAGGGIGVDSAVLGISHSETCDGRAIVVLDLLREVRPPFSPEQVCADFARSLNAYGITTAHADRWAGQFPVEQMRKHGVTVMPSDRSKSEIYRDLLPVVNSGTCELSIIHGDHAAHVARTANGSRRPRFDRSPARRPRRRGQRGSRALVMVQPHVPSFLTW